MEYTEKQNKTIKALFATFFSLQNSKKLIDYQSGIFDFLFTDRKFRVDINNLENAENIITIWKNLYNSKKGVM